MDIKTLQKKFSDILKERYQVSEDDEKYIKDVVASRNIKIMKDIIFFWRANEIENYANLSSALLKKTGKFEAVVKDYYFNNDFSNYIEILGRSFLKYLKENGDSLVSFTASFELAMLEVKSESSKEFFIETHYDPHEVFNYILSDNGLPVKGELNYIVRVSKSIENYFSVISKN